MLKNNNWVKTIIYISYLSMGLVVAGILLPAQSDLFQRPAIFMACFLLIGMGGYLFWQTCLHPKRSHFLKKYYALHKAARYPFSRFFTMPEWFFRIYWPVVSLLIFLTGIFVLMVAISEFVFGRSSITIHMRLPFDIRGLIELLN